MTMLIKVKRVTYLGGHCLKIEFSNDTDGYDWDPIALHDEMKKAGLLHRIDAVE